MPRPRGFINWNPRKATLLLVDAIQGVLDEYRDLLPLTLRQVFYRLVVQGAIDKTENDYSRLCEIANKARRAQLINMGDIRDDGFSRSEPAVMHSAEQLVRLWGRDLSRRQIDRQSGQERRLVVWCEAGGMVPMLTTTAHKYGIPVVSSGGFDSLTSKHEMAVELGRSPCEVLHIGDYDASGVHVFSSLAEDVQAFTNGQAVRFTRIAVTAEQIARWDLPTAPPKATDRRKFDDTKTVQAEAIAPNILVQFLDDEITSRLDMAVYLGALEAEAELRAEVDLILKQVG